MTVVSVLCGAPTPTGARVIAECTGSSVRLAVDTEPIDPLAPAGSVTYYGPITPDANDIVRFNLSGLSGNTRYHYRVEEDSTLDTDFPGQFLTDPPPGQPASFTIGFATCWGTTPDWPDTTGNAIAPNRISNSPVLGIIRDKAVSEDWRRWIIGGDIHYYDLGRAVGHGGIPNGASGATATYYRRAYSDVLLQSNAHNLYRNVPSVYTWDDHDFGPDNSDRTAPGRDAAIQVYQERWPHYPLGSTDNQGIYQSFTIGRVLFVITDGRANRDPNSTEQSPSKTMLGAAQLQWLEQTLATSTAEALVMVSGSQWEYRGASPSDTWTNFSHERDKVVQILRAPGGDASKDWTTRMCLLQGDAHSAGICSGPNNPWGGFPVFQFAAIDSTPSGAQTWKDIFRVTGRGLWGSLAVDDTGDRITVTGTVYQSSQDLASYAFAIDIDQPGPPPPEPPPTPPPPVAVPAIREAVAWRAVDDRTGRVIADLPDTTGVTSRLLMAYTSSRLEIPLGDLPIQVIERATQPQSCSIVQIVNDLPIWAGRVLVRGGGSGPKMTLGVASSEQYLLHRHVTARTYTGLDRALIAAELLSDAGSTGQGTGMALEIDYEPTGDIIDRSYLPTDLVTVYQALRELAEAGTLEWTIDYDWANADQTVLRRIMRLRPRIGRVQAAHPVFDASSGCTYTLTEDYSSGRYANHVRVYGDGEGDDLPMSDPHVDAAALAAGRPIVEHAVHIRDVSDPGELNAIAAAALARLMHGVELWEITAPLAQWPRPGMDASLGDWAAWQVEGPRHPDGVTGAGRVIGWDLDTAKSTWTPKLLDPHETVIGGTA